MNVYIIGCVLLQIGIINCLTVPDYFPERCKQSDPKYNKCLLQAVEKTRPYLIKGVPELKLPSLDPLLVDHRVVNSSVGDLVQIHAVLDDVKILGFAGTVIDKLRFNPKTLVGELAVTVPFFQLFMEYDVSGQLLIIPLRSKGYCQGNFTDTTFNMKFGVKRVERDGQEYLQIDKFLLKSRVGDGVMKLTSKNPELQFAADLIANFYNADPRLAMDAVNPIFVQYAANFFMAEFNKGLYDIPSNQLLPE